MIRGSSAALLLALGCGLGCGLAVADDSPSKRFEHDVVVRLHMHESYGLVRAMEHLLLHGKLADARDLARAIATAPDEPGTTPFAAAAARVRERAAAVADATTVGDALHREARLAAACAGCHADAGVLPDLATPPPLPPDKPDVVARMARHRWAADRLWEGMVGMSEPAWRAGLDVLAAPPLTAAELGPGREALARELRRAAERARHQKSEDAAPASDARAAVYGDLLATCAACHTQP